MGVLFSCPVDEDGDISSECAGLVAAPVLKASLSSAGKLRIEGSLSFKRQQQQQQSLETKISTAVISPSSGAVVAAPAPMATPREILRRRFAAAAMAETAEGPKQQRQQEAAAVTVQKVYKSFRTRRRLADCAVLAEQSWWELLDFALLRRSSVSFFDIRKPESAVSRWARARTRAAKVGKGLSKDDKARKLALQHWLEAIDPRHRYGHNLHYYYDCWLRCESKEPFFYWLDVGEGKEINLEDRCTRSKLLSQCIKYLGPKEREDYEVVIEDGEFMYKNSRQILDTSGGPRDAKWIFVLSTSRNLYVGQKKKGTFQHSSFLAGGATSAAGRLVVEDGILKAIWPHSGHYRPTEENFQEFQSFLKENSVDLSDVKMSPTEEDEEFWSRLRSIPSDRCADAEKPEEEEEQQQQEEEAAPSEETVLCQAPQITETAHEALEKFPRRASGSSEGDAETPTTSVPEDHQEGESNNNNNEARQSAVAREKKVLERKASCQLLGKQPSFKWTTGAGPRIVCVRDYPPELQHRALEEVHLSPRSGGGGGRSRFASPQRSGGGSPMSRGCEPLTTPREAFRRATHLKQQQGLLIW